jgi:uncharacterized protein
MDKLQDIIGDYHSFIKQILKETVDAGFDLAEFVQMDHMCYRVTSLADYYRKKRELLNVGKLLGEAQVNGRSIATIRLHKPVRYDKWRVDVVELPAPKEGADFAEGLEHVEFVLFDDKEDFLKKYADKQFNLKSADRGINPEIGFKLPSYGIKFHLLNLPTVVYIEKKLGINDVRDGR